MTRHFGHFDILITTPTEEFILILSDGSDGAIPLPAITASVVIAAQPAEARECDDDSSSPFAAVSN
ncbi:uncharacterized protein ACLA_055910 [Aspergillus clavatus NRRL 1]|uniref:Uncharacterized protein n=1 Tax=Aspergillus clavatus (strain ATCC 1007 / CBS 513.65 / DSM 816 / NCTC 3887 / NRRL 1 / QM 1276 / 107) TaxID=344612 RepID=A1C9L9_ASPCL|nr:uncharacterized protein ACLA_055910 [Aspergillus clavatus NRRL 1]EAW13543.1 hypothetical protein ACLA_055910 [Aspergillus clavatus NRRL 1]